MAKAKRVFSEVEHDDYCIDNLSCSIMKFFDLKPEGNTMAEADAIIYQKYRHIVVVSIDGLREEFLEHDLTHRDFLRRHFLNSYSMIPEEKSDSKKESFISYSEIVKQINEMGNEKIKAFEIQQKGPKGHNRIGDWSSAIRKTCKSVKKTFTYAHWEDLQDLLKIDHKNTNGVMEMVQDLNSKLSFLCEDLEETVFFITSTSKEFVLESDEQEKKVPLIWYENKPKRSGLVIYYAIVFFVIIYLINVLM